MKLVFADLAIEKHSRQHRREQQAGVYLDGHQAGDTQNLRPSGNWP